VFKRQLTIGKVF